MNIIQVFIATYIAVIATAANADTYEAFEKEIIAKNEKYEFVKCQKGKSHHTARLTYKELCKYGNSCPKQRERKQSALCREELLSECFNKKAWLTKNGFFGVSEDINIATTASHHKQLNGKRFYLHCAYYN